MFFYEFCKIFNNTFFMEHLRAIASVSTVSKNISSQNMCNPFKKKKKKKKKKIAYKLYNIIKPIKLYIAYNIFK